MRSLQPQVKAIQERYAGDQVWFTYKLLHMQLCWHIAHVFTLDSSMRLADQWYDKPCSVFSSIDYTENICIHQGPHQVKDAFSSSYFIFPHRAVKLFRWKASWLNSDVGLTHSKVGHAANWGIIQNIFKNML